MSPRPRLVVARFSAIAERRALQVRVRGLDLVLIREGDDVSVLYGRCPHRGAAMGDARVEGPDLICAAHGWDFCFLTGVSPSSPEDRLHKFESAVDLASDEVLVSEEEIDRFFADHPQAFDADEHLGV